MYIALGQGQTAPRGQNFDVNRKALSLYSLSINLYPFVASFIEISLKFDFIQCFEFHDLIHVHGQGAYSPAWDKVLMSTETSVICC